MLAFDQDENRTVLGLRSVNSNSENFQPAGVTANMFIIFFRPSFGSKEGKRPYCCYVKDKLAC